MQTVGEFIGVSPQRYFSFDVLKAICTFLVVCIHCPFAEPAGEYIKTITRCAVPVFFMISGFFYSSGDNGRWRTYAKRIALIVLGANILYFAWSLMLSIYGGYIDDFIGDILNWKKWAIFFLLNDSMFSFHLWYLGAILYVTLFYRALRSKGKEKILLYISPVLIAGSIVVGKYSKVIWGVDIPLEYSRNWILTGLPYYTIGAFVFDNKNQRTVKKGNFVVSLISLIVFSALAIIERYLLVSKNLNAAGDIFISTPALTLSAFLIAYKYIGVSQTKLSDIGRRYTTPIYVLHVMVDKILLFLGTAMGLWTLYGPRPIVVYCLTLLVAIGTKRIKKTICKGKMQVS